MVNDTARLSPIAALSISLVGFFIALALLVQSVLSPHVQDTSTFAAAFVVATNSVVLPVLLWLSTRNKTYVIPSFILLHVSMATVMVFFDQVYSPFTPLWAAIVLLSTLYFGWKGFFWSNSSFIATAITYVALFGDSERSYDSDIPYALTSLMVVTMTVFLSYVFVSVIMESQKKNKELRKAKQSEQIQINRANILLNSINDPVLTLDIKGKITSQNAAAQAFFDTNESLINKHIDALFQLHDQINRTVTIKSLMKDIKSSLLRDDISIGSGPGLVRLQIQMSKIRGTFKDADEGFVLIMRDITKQKSLEDEKDEFISVVSHELRTPVAIAEGSLSNLLLMQERDTDKKKMNNASQEAHRQIVYLAQMINDLSTLSRAERGIGDATEDIDIKQLLQELYGRYTPEAESKKLTLNLDLAPRIPAVHTSRLYLEEILQNFITNSLKYTKSGSVTISAKPIGHDRVCFSVIDTGIGMTKADLKHIFEKFYRSEDFRTRETSGTGLGLYVVNKLADKLGISIEVSSRLNHGSTFSFELPLDYSKTNQRLDN